MSSTDEERWRLRLDRFGAALGRLDEACEQASYTNLERAGLIQTSVFSYELGWKAPKDLSFYERRDANSPREAVRKGFEAGYLDEEDCETFLDAIGRRNMLSRAWRDDMAREAEALIKGRYHPMLRRLRRRLERRRAS